MAEPYWSPLYGEWVLLLGEGEAPPPRTGPHDAPQLILGTCMSQQADQPERAWVAYHRSEWPFLRQLDDTEKLQVHQVKRIFGGRIVEIRTR